MEHLDEIEKLVDLVSRSRIHELTAQVAGRRITITGGRPLKSGKPAVPTSSQAASSEPGDLPGEESGSQNGNGAHKVIAPMVGIFHHASPPVAAGLAVKAGQVIGIIESMKLMNDLRSEESGTITSVNIEDGRAVEYGQTLFEVEPAVE